MVRLHPRLPDFAGTSPRRRGLPRRATERARRAGRRLYAEARQTTKADTPNGSCPRSRSRFPTGRSVRCLPAARLPTSRPGCLRGWPGRRLPRVVDGQFVDLTYPLTQDAPGRTADRQGARTRCTSIATARRICWRRRSRICSPARSAASVRRPTKGSSTISSSPRPFVPEDLEAIEQKMKELAAAGPALRAADVAARGGDRLLPRSRRAAQGAAHRGEDSRPAEVSCYTIKDSDTFVDFCVGPHVPSTRTAEGVQAASTRPTPTGRGTRRTSRCSASTARRSSPTRSCRRTCSAIEEAKKRDHRKLGRELGLFMFHPWAPGAAFWLGKGTTLYNTLADYMRGVLFPAGYQ